MAPSKQAMRNKASTICYYEFTVNNYYSTENVCVFYINTIQKMLKW
jgi:hypothetical protein